MVRRSIRLIECVGKNDKGGQEEPIVKEFLKMACWPCKVTKAYGKEKGKNQSSFLTGLLKSKSRFIHVSSHGSGSKLVLDKFGNKVDVAPGDIEKFCQSNKLRRPLRNKLISISACGDISPEFARSLNDIAGASAVVTPLASVSHDESALFTMLLYYCLLGRADPDEEAKTDERLAQFIDAFNRARNAYLNVGGSGAHRLDYWWRGDHVVIN